MNGRNPSVPTPEAAQVAVSSIWPSVADGLPGLVLQWVLVPAVLALVERASRHV